MKYWTTKHQQAIENWYWCCTATTSASTRNYIYNATLYSAFDVLIDKLFTTYTIGNKEDIRQDLHILIWEKLLNRLKPNLLKAANQYLYVCCHNYIYSKFIQPPKLDVVDINSSYDDNDYMLNIAGHNEFNSDYEVLRIDNRIRIINELEEKQKKFSDYSTMYLYLEFMKQYIIQNDFNTDGFDVYIMNAMQISKENYTLINYKLRIGTKPFKTHKLK